MPLNISLKRHTSLLVIIIIVPNPSSSSLLLCFWSPLFQSLYLSFSVGQIIPCPSPVVSIAVTEMVKNIPKIIHFTSVFALKQELWLAMAHKHQTAIIMLTTKWVRPFPATY